MRGLAKALHAGVRSVARAAETVREPVVYARQDGSAPETVRVLVSHRHRVQQSASMGDGAQTLGYRLTVFGGLAGARVGDVVTVDGAPRRVLEVRGPRDGEGRRFATRVEAASHGPLFDPAFYIWEVSVRAAPAGYGDLGDPVVVRAAVQTVTESVAPAGAGQGGRAEVAETGKRLVVAGAVAIGPGAVVTLPAAFGGGDHVVRAVEPVTNPVDGLVDHQIVRLGG